MFFIEKRLEISAAHCLQLDYESKCKEVHGHNWIIIVHCKTKQLNHNGMVLDFTELKKNITAALDHKLINNISDIGNPTAENMAYWICENTPYCYKVEVQESEGNKAVYEDDI